MTVVTPDAASFIARQDFLRTSLGGPVSFHVPTVPEWPEGTKINPTTGLPYDAMVEQTNENHTTVVKTCLIIRKQGSPLRPQSDTDLAPPGEMSGMDIIIDIDDEDYAAVEDASVLVADGLDYDVREAKPFSIGGTIYRYLIYGEQQ